MAEDKKLTEEVEDEEEYENWSPDKAGEVSDESDWTLDSSVDHEWEAAEAKTGFPDIPPGTYEVVVEKVERKTAQQSGNKMLSWVMTITEGELKGQKLFKNHVFIGPCIPFIKGDFSICKIVLSPPIPESILAILPSLPGIMLKVKVVKQKSGEGINVHFKEYLGKMVKD